MYDITNPIHYIAANNPAGVNRIFAKYGFPQASEDEIIGAAEDFVEEYGEKGANALLTQHPDKDAILSRYSQSLGNLPQEPPIRRKPDPGDELEPDGTPTSKPPKTENQDRWILIALLLLAVFFVGNWLGGGQKK